MNFTSDNAYGVSPRIMRAIEAANSGPAAAYGDDVLSGRLDEAFGGLFETEVAVIPVATGTAANALALSAHVPPYGVVLCHADSHILTSECGAVEFYGGGARLAGLAGADGKLHADGLRAALDGFAVGSQHHMQPAALSLTQATEAGTVYTAAETAALAGLAREAGLAVHMDGARFANAVAALDAAPAELTWRAGVDALSFGATKNGALAAEAVILFAPGRREEVIYRRKRGGHLLSKSRFVAAQLLAAIEDGHWLELAGAANARAARLADGLASGGMRLAWPVEANEVFCWLPRPLDERLRAAGALYHQWAGTAGAAGEGDDVLVRLVASCDTPEADIDRFLALVDEA